jgi:hypothetical protein
MLLPRHLQHAQIVRLADMELWLESLRCPIVQNVFQENLILSLAPVQKMIVCSVMLENTRQKLEQETQDNV